MPHSSPAEGPAIDIGVVKEWVAEAGRLALAHRGRRAVSLKADATPVTQVDHAVESYLVSRIRAHDPAHRILTEESGWQTEGNEAAGRRPLVWILDPLDGTRAFASGLPIWGISVGLLRGEEPLLGVFHMPAVGEMYWANDAGAFCNDTPLAEPTPRLDDPLGFLAVPSNVHRAYGISLPRVRSLGSTAAHLVYVATGTAVGALTRRVSIWDLAGVLPLLLCCRIELRYLSGAPVDLQPLLHNQRAHEPIVVAHTSVIEAVRRSITLRPQ